MEFALAYNEKASTREAKLGVLVDYESFIWIKAAVLVVLAFIYGFIKGWNGQ